MPFLSKTLLVIAHQPDTIADWALLHILSGNFGRLRFRKRIRSRHRRRGCGRFRSAEDVSPRRGRVETRFGSVWSTSQLYALGAAFLLQPCRSAYLFGVHCWTWLAMPRNLIATLYTSSLSKLSSKKARIKNRIPKPHEKLHFWSLRPTIA